MIGVQRAFATYVSSHLGGVFESELLIGGIEKGFPRP